MMSQEEQMPCYLDQEVNTLLTTIFANLMFSIIRVQRTKWTEMDS